MGGISQQKEYTQIMTSKFPSPTQKKTNEEASLRIKL